MKADTMKRPTQMALSMASIIGSILVGLAVFILAFPVPKVVAIWIHGGRGLDTAGRQLTADFSAAVQTYGLAILTLTLLMFIGSLVWRTRLADSRHSG
jgi:type II secretory pathway component PulF